MSCPPQCQCSLTSHLYSVVSGHYDSRVTSILNNVDDAPGADDDASGVAVSMELARIFSAHNVTTPATMLLVAVAGEEQGLFGSTFLAQSLFNASADVQAAFTNDIVGASVADDGTSDPNDIRLFVQGIPSTESAAMTAERIQIGGENDSPTRQIGRFVGEVASNSATNMTGESDHHTILYNENALKEPRLLTFCFSPSCLPCRPVPAWG